MSLRRHRLPRSQGVDPIESRPQARPYTFDAGPLGHLVLPARPEGGVGSLIVAGDAIALAQPFDQRRPDDPAPGGPETQPAVVRPDGRLRVRFDDKTHLLREIIADGRVARRDARPA